MSWIKSILDMIGGRSIATFVVVIISLSSVSYGLYQKNTSLQTELNFEVAQRASIEANLKSSLESIVTLNQRIKDAKRASQEFLEVNKVINDKYIKLESEYNGYLGRDHIIQKKPTLVNKRMNKAFNSFVDEVSCNSGVETSCLKD